MQEPGGREGTEWTPWKKTSRSRAGSWADELGSRWRLIPAMINNTVVPPGGRPDSHTKLLSTSPPALTSGDSRPRCPVHFSLCGLPSQPAPGHGRPHKVQLQ